MIRGPLCTYTYSQNRPNVSKLMPFISYMEYMGLMVLLQGVMLQGAARRVRTVPNSCCKGASEGCCCALQGAVVGFFSEAAGPVANGCKEKSLQNTSSDLANVPRFRIGKFEV